MSETLSVIFYGNKTISIPPNIDKTPVKYIVFQDGFTFLPAETFLGFPNLINITLPDTLESIDDHSFAFDKLMKYILLPKGVKDISPSNPFDMTQIEYIDVAADNPYLRSVDGVLFSRNMTILYEFPTRKNTATYVIPNTVTNLRFGAFNRAAFLKRIIIPDSVVDLSEEFCYGNSDVLEEVVIYRYYGQCVPYIGPNSFYSTTFQKSNIIYVYYAKVIKTCNTYSFSLLISDIIFIFFLV